jgi:hypothetical protein
MLPRRIVKEHGIRRCQRLPEVTYPVDPPRRTHGSIKSRACSFPQKPPEKQAARDGSRRQFVLGTRRVVLKSHLTKSPESLLCHFAIPRWRTDGSANRSSFDAAQDDPEPCRRVDGAGKRLSGIAVQRPGQVRDLAGYQPCEAFFPTGARDAPLARFAEPPVFHQPSVREVTR